jgi:hypothetical protein
MSHKGSTGSAREEYIAYVRNLNIANPTGKQIDPEGPNGYGRALKWVFVDPVIEGGKIKGVKIVGEWVGGTHLSSSGVALPDQP